VKSSKTPPLGSALVIAFLALGSQVHADPTALQWSRANPSSPAPSPRIDAPIAYDSAGVVPFWLMLRRGAILSPRMTGATTGLLAGLVGTSVLEIHCPNLDAWHIFWYRTSALRCCVLWPALS